MDVPWALEHLDHFVRMTELQWSETSGILGVDSRRPRASNDDIVRAAHVVEQVLDRVLPDWRTAVPANSRHRWEQAREAAFRAATQLRGDLELQQRLGDNSPRVTLGGLHPWVWDAARSLWTAGSYRVAVAQAAAFINTHMQAKAGRDDVADDALVGQLFSENAPAMDKPRFGLPASTLIGRRRAASVAREPWARAASGRCATRRRTGRTSGRSRSHSKRCVR